MGVGGHRHAPAALTPLKTRYALYRRLGGPQGRSGQVRKISPPPGFDHRTVQLVASRYTDWATCSLCISNWRKKNISYMWRLEGSLLHQREMQIRPVHGVSMLVGSSNSGGLPACATATLTLVRYVIPKRRKKTFTILCIGPKWPPLG